MPDPNNDMLVAFDDKTGQVTVSNLKSRMSVDEAADLSAQLTATIEAQKPKPAA